MNTNRTGKTVIVIGHINHDRIWHLTEPLRAGGRIAWRAREARLGGGGYFTARRLLDFGHHVRILSNLMSDSHGQNAFTSLAEDGFDTSLITERQGETDFADILLDPTGERTILSNERRLARTFALAQPAMADAFYINGPHLCETIRQSLNVAPLVVSQLPLRDGEPRPADVIVGSKADMPGKPIEAIWRDAQALAGARLRHLIMTDGPEPTSVFDGETESTIPVPIHVTVRDTIGAGDTFSGALIDSLLKGAEITDAALNASRSTAEWLLKRETMFTEKSNK